VPPPRDDMVRSHKHAGHAAFFAVEHTLVRTAGTALNGTQQFRRMSSGGDLFNERVLSALRNHARTGATIVLVSPMASALLKPIAEYVEADRILRPSAERVSSRTQARTTVPSPVWDRADAMRTTAATLGIALHRSYAYAGSLPDLPMLQTVGRPRVVGDDPRLIDHAGRVGWPKWPSATGRKHSSGPALPSPLDDLSQRQLQVLELMAQGCSNLVVGQRLRLSSKTVEAHVRGLFTKLGLEQRADEHRRVMAVLMYLRSHL
jgi:phosphoserine phosphatase/DNA-binding CsgD family transcriptional regulator